MTNLSFTRNLQNNIDLTFRLTILLSEVLLRMTSARFGVRYKDCLHAEYNEDDEGLALSTAMYIMNVGLGMQQNDVAALYNITRFKARRAIADIEDLRERDQLLNLWLDQICPEMHGINALT